MKSQGTCKLSTYCTVLIRTTTEQTRGKIQTEVYDTHYGHTTDLRHLHLPDNIRVSIDGQLPQGVSFQHISDYVDDNIGTNLKQIHLINK